MSFENVGAESSYSIAELLSVTAPKGAATCIVTADQLWLWDSDLGDWVKYFYKTNVGWCKKDTTVLTTDKIGLGQTIFFRRANGGVATTLTLSGAVKEFVAQPAYNAPAAGKFAFMGYPWPVAMPIAGFEKFQGAEKGAATCIVTADQIWLWNTTAGDWDKYFYRSTNKVWCKKGESVETTDVIPAGEGFFFRRANGGTSDTITFTYSSNN